MIAAIKRAGGIDLTGKLLVVRMRFYEVTWWELSMEEGGREGAALKRSPRAAMRWDYPAMTRPRVLPVAEIPEAITDESLFAESRSR